MSFDRFSCEPLESRSLYSATPAASYLLTGDKLTISGTAHGDRIDVRTTSAGVTIRSYGLVPVVTNGRKQLVAEHAQVWRFPAGTVRAIHVDGGSGSDTVTVDVSSNAVTAARRVETRAVVLASGEVVRDVATRPEPGTVNGSTDQWLARFAAQKRSLRGLNPKTVFIGDSLVERLPGYDPDSWKTLQRNYDAANLGLFGDTTSSLLYRLQNGVLHGLKPSLVFLCVGTNNVGLTDDVDQTLGGIMAVVHELRRQLPDAKIVVSSILPRGAIGDDAFVPKLNSMLSKQIFDEDYQHVRFSNAARAFLGANYRSGDFEISSVHLTRSGYQRWVKVILQDLTQALTT